MLFGGSKYSRMRRGDLVIKKRLNTMCFSFNSNIIGFFLKLLLFNCLILIAHNKNEAQELKKISKQIRTGEIERYYVLKENKSVKHGQYVRYKKHMLGENVQEFGQFYNNNKIGTWYEFYDNDVNSLRSSGEYLDGMKSSYWIYFLGPNFNNINMVPLIMGHHRKTQLLKPNKLKEPYKISFDTSGLKISSYGKYKEGEKIGKWFYLARIGVIITIYDHSNNLVIENLPVQDKSPPFIYLGGPEHFSADFAESFYEKLGNKSVVFPDTLNYNLYFDGESISIERLNYKSNPKFDFVDKSLNEISQNWVPVYDTNSYNTTRIKVFFKNEDSKSLLIPWYLGSDSE